MSRGKEDMLLGIDIGTQGVKAVLITENGRIVAQSQKGHGSYTPRPDWCGA